MTITPTPYVAGIQQAMEQGQAPIIVSRNVFRGSTPIWSSSNGFTTDTDVTETGRFTSYAFDGLGDVSTYGTGTATNWWFVVDFGAANRDMDVIGIIFASPLAANLTSVLAEVGDSATFADVGTVATWTNPRVSGQNLRLLSILNGAIFVGLRYFRVRFTYATAQPCPRIGEIFLGARRQLSRNWNFGGDDFPYGGISDQIVGRARGVVSYQRAHGFSDFEFEYSPVGSDQYGLNDITTFRLIATDSQGGTIPVLFIPRPYLDTTLSGSWQGSRCFLGKMNDALFLPTQGPFERLGEFTFNETTPFYALET